MRDLIAKVPIPAAGVALGLAALGNLLQPYAEALHILCGATSVLFLGLLIAKLVLYPSLVCDDLKNPIFATVSATAFMALMQISTYIASIGEGAIGVAFALWAAAILGHFALMAWFTFAYVRRFSLKDVFPTYFICYVGIIVASVTAPVFGLEFVGHALFWFGFASYAVLLVAVTWRYVKHPVPEAARPLFCIYTAPMSLSLVGYLACAPSPDPLFAGILLVLGQLMFVLVLSRLPRFVGLPFYPSFAAMTFPFVITATALSEALPFLAASGVAVPDGLYLLALVETAFATVMVAFVVVRYAAFLLKRPESREVPAPSSARAEAALALGEEAA